MSLKTSTGLRNKLLDTNPLKTIMAAGFIKMYKGAVPSSADDAVNAADLLCTIYSDGAAAGINFAAAAVGGSLAKSAVETWSGTVTGAGTNTTTFYRHVAVGDDGTSSTTQPRLQGTIGTAGADMNLSSTSLVNSAVQTIDYYSVTLPTL